MLNSKTTDLIRIETPGAGSMTALGSEWIAWRDKALTVAPNAEDAYEAEARQRQAERDEREHQRERLKLASAIYRDGLNWIARTVTDGKGEERCDFRVTAVAAVEAADELLNAMKLQPDQVIPPCEG